jgi:hypothetical protein
MLEIPEVDLNQEVQVPRVVDLGEGVVEASVALLLPALSIHDVFLKLQILTGVVAHRASLLW